MKNKLLAVLLTAAMSTVLLAGCGGNTDANNKGNNTQETNQDNAGEANENNTGEESADGGSVVFPLDETMTFTMLAGFNSSEDTAYGEGSAFELLCQNANIEFEMQEVLLSDMGEKRGLIMGSNDYPDCLFKTNMWDKAEITDYGSQGILIPLEDLIREYAPNLTAVLDERDLWGQVASSDGHVYSIPEIDMEQPAGSVMFFINQKWLDNLGLEMPTDLDSLYTVLKAFKDEDANGNGDPDDEIPMIFDSAFPSNYMLQYFVDRFDTNASWCYITEDGEVVYTPTSDVFKEYLEYMAKLYEEGLIYSASYTQTLDQRHAVGMSGEVLGSYLDAGPNSAVTEEHYADYTPVPAFSEGTYPVSQGIVYGTFAITDACENPEILIAWIDQWFSEEGGIYAWMGIEGVNYTVNEDGSYTMIEDADNSIPDVIQGGAHHPSIQPQYLYSGSTDAQTIREYEYKNGLTENGWSVPAWTYTAEQYEEVNTYATDCWNYWIPYQAEVITGVTDLESSWDEYIETMNELGAEGIERIYNEIYSTMQ